MQVEASQSMIRIVGLSATLPNYKARPALSWPLPQTAASSAIFSRMLHPRVDSKLRSLFTAMYKLAEQQCRIMDPGHRGLAPDGFYFR